MEPEVTTKQRQKRIAPPTSLSTISGAAFTNELKDKSDELLKHPLFLILITTFLTSVLVPFGSDILAKQKAQREARQSCINRILDYDATTRQALLSLHTRLYVFDETMRSFKPTQDELRKEQLTLASVALQQYLEYDNGVWTAPKKLITELRIYHLASPEAITSIRERIAQYHGIVWTARNAIHSLRLACMSEEYTPGQEKVLLLHEQADAKWALIEKDGTPLLLEAAQLIQ